MLRHLRWPRWPSTPLQIQRHIRTPVPPKGSRRNLDKRPPPIPRGQDNPPPKEERPSSSPNPSEPQSQDALRLSAVSSALATTEGNALLAPVHIPEDPHGVLKENHPAMSILANSSVVVQRQIEMMNLFLGFEQANRYIIMDGAGRHIGYLAEQQHGISSAIARQAFRTHRSFTTHVFDREQREVLRFHRPFSFINSRINVYDAVDPKYGFSASAPGQAFENTSALSLTNEASAPQLSQLSINQMRLIGEAQQQWAPLRRKYNLFLHRDLSTMTPDSGRPQLSSGDLPLSNSMALEKVDEGSNTSSNSSMIQFAYVNEPFLSWDFGLKSANEEIIGGVSRNFSGFAREIFTDTGVYMLQMDSAALAASAAANPFVNQTSPGLQPENGTVEDSVAGMTLDQRAVMLATAVSIDFDYFSRHSGHGVGMGLPLPIWIPGGGGAAAEGAAGAEGAAAGAGAIEGAAGTAVGTAARGAAIGEAGAGAVGGAVGAGSIAGAEAMRGAYGQSSEVDDASPRAGDPYNDPSNQTGQPQGQEENVWGSQDPWAQPQNPQDPPSDNWWGNDQGGGQGGGGGGSGGGGDGGSWFDEFF